MSRVLNVVDSDGHVLEPLSWEKYIDPAFRGRAPRIVIDSKGGERFYAGDQLLSGAADDFEVPLTKMGVLGGVDFQGAAEVRELSYADAKRGGSDPQIRLKDMDAEEIDAAVLYPTLGLFVGTIKDPDLAAASCRAYNRWLAEYCSADSTRLYGSALLPVQSVEAAVKELRFAVKELGFCSAFVRPDPYNERTLHHPANAPLWREAQELDVAIAIHASGQPILASDRFHDFGPVHIVSHTLEMMAAMVSMITCGVCSQFPRLRVAFLEAGGGWILAWLDRMDRHYTNKALNDTKLNELPSDIFRRQCFIAFEPVEQSLKLMAEIVGPDKIVWGSDYPHIDGFIDAPGLIRKMGLPPETLAGVLAGGAKRLYQLQ